MNAIIKQTPFTVEDTQYEFCDDLWNYIKEFLFYDKEWYNAIILSRCICLRDEVLNYCLSQDKVTYQSKPLFNAIKNKVTRGCYTTPFETRVLAALALPRFHDFALAILKEGRIRGYKFANFHYYEWKKLINKGEVDEKEGLETFISNHNKLWFLRNSRKYLLDFLEDVEEVEKKQLKNASRLFNKLNKT
jgi:hypothetical protein